MDNMKHRRLQELDRSDFGIVEGEPDIRGWDVRNENGEKIGEVEELILDAQQKKVRYMVVEFDDDDLDLEDDKKVLIPIGLAELDKEEDEVILPTISVAQLKALPAYDANNLDEETEQRVCEALGRSAGTGTTREHTGEQHPTQSGSQYSGGGHEADFYRHEHFNDNNLYKNRQHEAKLAEHRKSQQGKQDERQQQESEYERGLRLWEMRSEGGILPGDNANRQERKSEVTDEQRREMIHNRRKLYEDRRSNRKDNTIIQRIKNEGLQDGGR